MRDQSGLALVLLVLQVLQVTPGTDAKVAIINGKTDIQVGSKHILVCKSGKDADITWQKDGLDVEDTVVKMDETTSKLTIQSATMEHSGLYTCLCEYDENHTDEESVRLYIYEGFSFGSTPTYHEFLEGSSAMVPCLAEALPAVEVHWYRDQQKLSSDEGERIHQLPDNSLSIEPVRKEDTGTYVCKASIPRRPIEDELKISVVINAPPTVHIREKVKKVMAGPETNVSLLCLVDGNPKPSINWHMPVNVDPLRHHFNSDNSELTIRAVARGDFGEYTCTAKNKISESSAVLQLHVSEAPEVFLRMEQSSVSRGQSVSVACNVSGHPAPQLHWLSKKTGQTLTAQGGRVHVQDGVLVLEDVAPSDGGLYSCMATSPSGNASRDFTLLTEPGPPQGMNVNPGPTSIHFSVQVPPIDGGTPILSYSLQWKKAPTSQWEERMVQASEPLDITSLKPYSSYLVRLAAVNAVGRGEFSETHNLRTEGVQGEPDRPVLSSNQVQIDGNTFSVPLKQLDNGGSGLLHFTTRYRQDKQGEDWKEIQLLSDASSIRLPDLEFGSDYLLEVMAVNANGSSEAATLNFTMPQQEVTGGRPGLSRAGVVGVVLMIFVLLVLAVDGACCYLNRCGLLMLLTRKLLGRGGPYPKSLEDPPCGGKTPPNGDLPTTEA